MALSDQEARQIAEALLANIEANETDAAQTWSEFYMVHHSDVLAIAPHLMKGLNEACRRFKEGDHSVETSRLVASAFLWVQGMEAYEAEQNATKSERKAERRAATLVEIGPAPDIADRMTGIGLHGIPLPDDVVPDEQFLATRVAHPEALMAWYIHHLRGTGWTLDLDNSRPKASSLIVPQSYFSRSDLPDRYVSILTGPAVDDPGMTRLLVSEHDD